MKNSVTIYELYSWDGADGRNNSPMGILTTDKEVAEAWTRGKSRGSCKTVSGVLIRSLDEIPEAQTERERARALAKLSPRERSLLGLSDGPVIQPTDGEKLLAETQRAAFERCAAIIKDAPWEKIIRRSKTDLGHLMEMCQVGAANAGAWPADKTGRWLGYVQGCLAARDMLDVDAERDLTRGDFRTAYALMGVAVPETVQLSVETEEAR